MPDAPAPTKTGGCQCGAVRFAVDAPLGEASVCHCRMCQKATGGAFGLFVRVPEPAFRWTRGAPRRFQSSNVARRGFCADCGTPLTWEFAEGFDVTVAAFDDASAVVPTVQLAIATRLPWLATLDGLPERNPATDAEYAQFMQSVVSYQHPDHDTAAWPPADRT